LKYLIIFKNEEIEIFFKEEEKDILNSKGSLFNKSINTWEV